MNLLSKKIRLFYISNIMVSLVSINIASATYTYKEEQNALAYAPKEVETEELEPVSQNGDNEEKADVAPSENVVVQKEVTGTRNYVPARYSEVTGQAVVDYAKKYLGLRYVSYGNSLSTGTDCSGFTKLIYNEFGVYLPRTVGGQMYSGSYVSKSDLKKGDIIIYGDGNGNAVHVAMYIGNGQVIHESNHRDGVKISSLYMMQYITARRVINDTAISIVEKQIEEANKEKEEDTLDTDESEEIKSDEESNVDDSSSSSSDQNASNDSSSENIDNTSNTELSENNVEDEESSNEDSKNPEKNDSINESSNDLNKEPTQE